MPGSYAGGMGSTACNAASGKFIHTEESTEPASQTGRGCCSLKQWCRLVNKEISLKQLSTCSTSPYGHTQER
jgi:hypothetical protein